MTRRNRVTNPLALAVLAMLVDRSMHPYEIAQLLKHRGKDQTIKIRYGSLYTVVQRLEKQGFVVAEGTAREGRRPERTVYRLTEDGREELEDRLRELLSDPVKEYSLFEAALSLAGVLSPDEVIHLLSERVRLLDVELAGTRAAMRELVVGQKLPRLFVLETEYAVAIKQAEADWVRGLVKELTEGSLDGIEYWRAWRRTGELPEELQELDWARTDRLIGGETTKPE
jgi:DNA-binding PadR family transcriptional regulator